MLTNVRRFAVTGNNFVSSPYNQRGISEPTSRNFQTTADAINTGNASNSGYSTGYSATGKQAFVGMLDGFLPTSQRIRNKIFRDIYHHDAVSGGAVDIYATMPFSDFYLTGLKSKEALEVYHKSIEKMRLKVMLPAISRDYLVLGKFIGNTVFDKNENMFSAILQQDVDSCSINEIPIAGMDPLIDLTIPSKLSSLLDKKGDPRVARILESLPDNIRNNLKRGNIPLEPANTLYIPRRTLASDSAGTSYYERILPIHLMEKAMIRGSIDQVQRRQRAILHITVSGDGDDFVPTLQNLEAMRDMFLKADNDPTGAIIVTHSGVQPSEIRSAGDFFRADELFEYFNSSKYKALGITEAMITGEANFNAMDATLSLFIENLREYRATLTREIFYEKIFPAIAYANGFTRDKYTVTGRTFESKNRVMGEGDYLYAICSGASHGFNTREKMVDTSTLAMPLVSWQKHLRPEGDGAFMDLLTAATQHGVPVPIMMMASAAGIDLNAVLNNMDQEISVRKRIKNYNKKLEDYQPNSEDQYTTESKLIELVAGGSKIKPKNFLNREYPEWTQPHNTHKNGKFRTTTARHKKELYERQMRILAHVMSKKQDDAKAEARAKRKPR